MVKATAHRFAPPHDDTTIPPTQRVFVHRHSTNRRLNEQSRPRNLVCDARGKRILNHLAKHGLDFLQSEWQWRSSGALARETLRFEATSSLFSHLPTQWSCGYQDDHVPPSPLRPFTPESGLVAQGKILTIALQTLSKPCHQLTSLQDVIQQAGKSEHEGEERGHLIRCSPGETSVRSC